MTAEPAPFVPPPPESVSSDQLTSLMATFGDMDIDVIDAAEAERNQELADSGDEATDSGDAEDVAVLPDVYAVHRDEDGDVADQADAQDEADRLLALFRQRRGLYRVVTKMQALRLELGDVVSVDTPRFGFAGGKLARVVGYRLDAARAEIELTLYA